MRACSLAMALGLLLVISFGLQLLAPPISAQTIPATIDIDPKTFNLMENGVITAYIWLPGYDVNQINVSAVKFDDQPHLTALRGSVEGDKMVVKFDAPSVASYIWTSKVYHMGTIPPQADCRIPIIITGSLFNGQPFQSQVYMLKIILPQPLSS